MKTLYQGGGVRILAEDDNPECGSRVEVQVMVDGGDGVVWLEPANERLIEHLLDLWAVDDIDAAMGESEVT